MNAGRAGACCEAVLLRKSDSVRDDADAIEADFLLSCTASRKFDAIVGSPPANRMFSSRCGFTARSIEDLTDVIHRELVDLHVLWLASMQGEHFRLQRFVRSTIRATPRPVRTVDGPWS